MNHSSFYSSSYSKLMFSCAQPPNRVSKVVADHDQYFELHTSDLTKNCEIPGERKTD